MIRNLKEREGVREILAFRGRETHVLMLFVHDVLAAR